MRSKMKSRRYLPHLKRRLSSKESVLGCARELIFRAAIYTNTDSKAGSLVPAYTCNVTGSVTVDELLCACERLLTYAVKCEVDDAYCTKAGTIEVVNLAMLELLLYQKQKSVKNTVKTVIKLQAALWKLRQKQVE